MTRSEIPNGVRFLHWTLDKLRPGKTYNTFLWYKVSIFVLTFAAYTSYHAAKKPLSVVKSYFQRDCDGLIPPPDIIVDANNTNSWCDWAPFGDPHGGAYLGILDSSFLIAYALAMFVSGFIAERVSLRYFLAVGMITTGISCYLFGIARYLNIHYLSYFIIIQIFGGVVQSTGWPSVVALMSKWFGKKRRGLIFGVWNSHTSVGNILGTCVAGVFLTTDWGLSFIMPGLIIAGLGFINFLFLVETPDYVGFSPNVSSELSVEGSSLQNESNASDYNAAQLGDQGESYFPNNESYVADSGTPLLSDQGESAFPNNEVNVADSGTPLLSEQNSKVYSNINQNRKETAVGMIAALKIPGVIDYSCSLFFAKLVSYTLLFWLPFYIKQSTPFSEKSSAYLSTIFDLGGIAGGILAGIISDSTGKSAITCLFMLIVSIPLLLVYFYYGALNMWLNGSLLAFLGFFVNGPYALITTAVSAELGTHRSLENNSKALATVAAIIDGTGSLGAAVGPLITGTIYRYGWQYVFFMLTGANVLGFLALLRMARDEISPS